MFLTLCIFNTYVFKIHNKYVLQFAHSVVKFTAYIETENTWQGALNLVP